MSTVVVQSQHYSGITADSQGVITVTSTSLLLAGVTGWISKVGQT